MGNSCQKQKEVKVVLIGLDLAGKTSILQQLCYNKSELTTPTFGFNLETISYGNLKIGIWDIGGQKGGQYLYRHYYPEADGVLFAIDSTDINRVAEAKDILHEAIRDTNDDAFVCVIANKRDLVDRCMSVSDIRAHLQLSSIPSNRRLTLIETSALSGAGLDKVLEWILEQANKSHVER